MNIDVALIYFRNFLAGLFRDRVWIAVRWISEGLILHGEDP